MLAFVMRILGVDPGTHRLGFSILEVDGPDVRCLDSGCLEAGRRDPLELRLHVLHQGLAELATRWHPEHLAVEEPFVAPARGAKSAVMVGQAQALALLVAADNGMEVYRYAPSAVKAAAAGYGASSKEQVQRALRLLLSLGPEPISTDASDAIAVALCHVQHWRTSLRARVS